MNKSIPWPEPDEEGKLLVGLLNEGFPWTTVTALREYLKESFPDVWEKSAYLRHYVNYM